MRWTRRVLRSGEACRCLVCDEEDRGSNPEEESMRARKFGMLAMAGAAGNRTKSDDEEASY